MGSIFPFLQSPGTSPDYHDFSNIMGSVLATTSGSSLRTLGCISSGPIDFCMFRFLRWSQTWPSLKVGEALPPGPHLAVQQLGRGVLLRR